MCRRRDLENAHDLHKQKLKRIKQRKSGSGTLDNRLPETSRLPHMKRNLRKERECEERYAEIERENGILLGKMILMRKSKKNATAPRPPTSAKVRKSAPRPAKHATVRKQEMEAIARENKILMKKIVNMKPFPNYSSKQWNEENKANKGYLKLMKPPHQTPFGVKERKGLRPIPHSALALNGKPRRESAKRTSQADLDKQITDLVRQYEEQCENYDDEASKLEEFSRKLEQRAREAKIKGERLSVRLVGGVVEADSSEKFVEDFVKNASAHLCVPMNCLQIDGQEIVHHVTGEAATPKAAPMEREEGGTGAEGGEAAVEERLGEFMSMAVTVLPMDLESLEVRTAFEETDIISVLDLLSLDPVEVDELNLSDTALNRVERAIQWAEQIEEIPVNKSEGGGVDTFDDFDPLRVPAMEFIFSPAIIARELGHALRCGAIEVRVGGSGSSNGVDSKGGDEAEGTSGDGVDSGVLLAVKPDSSPAMPSVITDTQQLERAELDQGKVLSAVRAKKQEIQLKLAERRQDLQLLTLLAIRDPPRVAPVQPRKPSAPKSSTVGAQVTSAGGGKSDSAAGALPAASTPAATAPTAAAPAVAAPTAAVPTAAVPTATAPAAIAPAEPLAGASTELLEEVASSAPPRRPSTDTGSVTATKPRTQRLVARKGASGKGKGTPRRPPSNPLASTTVYFTQLISEENIHGYTKGADSAEENDVVGAGDTAQGVEDRYLMLMEGLEQLGATVVSCDGNPEEVRRAMDSCDVVVVLVTNGYMNAIARNSSKSEGSAANNSAVEVAAAALEYEYACSSKGVHGKIVAVAMERRCDEPPDWQGPVCIALGALPGVLRCTGDGSPIGAAGTGDTAAKKRQAAWKRQQMQAKKEGKDPKDAMRMAIQRSIDRSVYLLSREVERVKSVEIAAKQRLREQRQQQVTGEQSSDTVKVGARADEAEVATETEDKAKPGVASEAANDPVEVQQQGGL
jgi:hypothetical protein